MVSDRKRKQPNEMEFIILFSKERRANNVQCEVYFGIRTKFSGSKITEKNNFTSFFLLIESTWEMHCISFRIRLSIINLMLEKGSCKAIIDCNRCSLLVHKSEVPAIELMHFK